MKESIIKHPCGGRGAENYLKNSEINRNSQALPLIVVGTPYDHKLKKKKFNLIEKLKSMTFEERFKELGLFGPVKTQLRD